MRTQLLALGACSLILTLPAFASTIELDSASNGVYTYGISVPPNTVEFFQTGASITLSGLYGVTGATSNYFTATFTSTSATFVMAYFGLSLGNGSPANARVYSDLFTVTSNSGSLGPAGYSTTDLHPSSGTVSGPAAPVQAPTPEPSSLALLGTGILGVFGATRKRFV